MNVDLTQWRKVQGVNGMFRAERVTNDGHHDIHDSSPWFENDEEALAWVSNSKAEADKLVALADGVEQAFSAERSEQPAQSKQQWPSKIQ